MADYVEANAALAVLGDWVRTCTACRGHGYIVPPANTAVAYDGRWKFPTTSNFVVEMCERCRGVGYLGSA